MATDPTRAVIIGCGAIAAQHLAYLTDAPGVDLVGVCDVSAATAEYTAGRYHTAWFTDASTMLDELHPDVVHVLTPPRSHRMLIELSLEAGAHVLCEKPIAASVGELRPLLALAERNRLVLAETHNYLFNDPVLEVDRIVAQGRIGTVVEAEIAFVLGVTSGGPFVDPNLPSPVAHLPGGAVHDFLTHLAYLGLHFLGDGDPTEVTARWRNLSGNARVVFDDLHGSFVIGDALGVVRFSATARPECASIRLRGTKGTLETDLYQPHLRLDIARSRRQLSGVVNQVVNGLALARSGATGLRDKVLQHTPYHGLQRFLDAFYTGLRTGAAPVSPLELLRTTGLIDALVAARGEA